MRIRPLMFPQLIFYGPTTAILIYQYTPIHKPFPSTRSHFFSSDESVLCTWCPCSCLSDFTPNNLLGICAFNVSLIGWVHFFFFFFYSHYLLIGTLFSLYSDFSIIRQLHCGKGRAIILLPLTIWWSIFKSPEFSTNFFFFLKLPHNGKSPFIFH